MMIVGEYLRDKPARNSGSSCGALATVELFAPRINIDADQGRFRKIMPPKRQGGAALGTDLEYFDFLIFERMQMAFVVTQEIDPNRAFLRALEKPDNIERGIVVH